MPACPLGIQQENEASPVECQGRSVEVSSFAIQSVPENEFTNNFANFLDMLSYVPLRPQQGRDEMTVQLLPTVLLPLMHAHSLVAGSNFHRLLK
jgi:hypothetical protein